VVADALDSSQLEQLEEQLEAASLTDRLRWAWQTFGLRAAIGTSFQGAGLVMIHHAVQAGIPLPIFTLDTQLFFPETYALKDRLEQFFGLEIESLLPEQTPAQQAAELGDALWARKPDLCCIIRKVEPLKKKLGTLDLWITGLRREQSETRSSTRVIERYKFDVWGDRVVLKLNPMVSWSRDDVWKYIHAHQIPYNPLHDRGYRSIGCAPCTRAVGEGESERAGRWTGFDKAECGIHTFLGDSI
jgi:phosphoadenosine phosphosulfate reductase